MAVIDSQVVVATIATIGGVVTTILTLKYKDYFTRRNAASAPKDRMERIFDGYESLIKELKDDSERKSKIIDGLQIIINSQRDEIEKSQGLINTLKVEVRDSRHHAAELMAQLDQMKRDYALNKEPIQ